MNENEPPDEAFASPEDPRWEILTPTQAVGPPSEPATHEEAKWFHEGFLAGATAYCAAVGHSCLKSDNGELRQVFDAQGWKTIEMFERLPREAESLADLLKQMSDNYSNACKLVADMHRAAMGRVCGPRRGVVEDVADLRAALIGMFMWQQTIQDLMPDGLSKQVRAAIGQEQP
jgi:hypothetical protein